MSSYNNSIVKVSTLKEKIVVVKFYDISYQTKINSIKYLYQQWHVNLNILFGFLCLYVKILIF